MTFEEILKDIKARKFQPVYFLHGEEPFFTDQLEAAIIAHALPEAERGFNQTILYGKDVEAIGLLDSLRRYPMMSERQVLILREAQDMKGFSELIGYMENPMPSTVFVVCYKHKKYDMGSKMGKVLKAKTLVFESKKLYDNQVPDWIAAYAKSSKMGLEPAAAQLLAEYLGADLGKIVNELDKLALNLPTGTLITVHHVQEYVGISKEYNIYELQKALAMRDKAKLARIEQYFSANIRKNPLIMTISSLYSFFSKVYMLHFLGGKPEHEIVKALELRSEWFLKEYKIGLQHYTLPQIIKIIELLKVYDLRSKGVDTDTTNTGEAELMKELFWKIIH
ncbi:MAG: DNA polymerase III subunit delta [Bacteroidetes bacterium]|nr:DNA polymerase III subunit delta [Bacteroidota bacterium]